MKTEKSTLISLILPVFNGAKFLERSIKYLLQQGLHSDLYEIIVIDDGSKDNSYKILTELKPIFNNVVILHQENCGVAATRNKGMKLAKGKWISFIDQDDLTVSTHFLK